jgi:aminopeptidase N
MRRLLLATLLLSACAPAPGEDPDETAWLEAVDDGKADSLSGVEVDATRLEIDLATKTGKATISFVKNGNVALNAAGLSVSSVTDDRGTRNFRVSSGKLRVSQVRGDLVVEYGFVGHDHADGLLSGGSTVLWPYFCGNLYPCHTQPSDGTTFALELSGVPDDAQAIYPKRIDAEAPPYMLAWAVGKYDQKLLGTTSAGTNVSVYWLAKGENPATTGTKNLVKVFDWYEQHVGDYMFGKDVGSVSVIWGEGMYGGMEHHPLWHVARDAMNDPVTHAHEAAHGWFGDGIRLKCWEDFILSEGTVSYLAARAIGQVAGTAAEAEVWKEYASERADAESEGGSPAWPTGCNAIDILEDKLFTNLPYMEGAFFYKAVADEVGAEELDEVIAKFYRAHKGKAARFQDMIDLIEDETGFDTADLVKNTLRKKF